MTKLLLIGCGNMGYAELRGWLASDLDLDITVVEPTDALRDRASEHGVKALASAPELPTGFQPDYVMLAVKPQILFSVCEGYRDMAATGETCFISIAAGPTIDGIEKALAPNGTPPPVIRAMPNTPVAVLKGATVCVANEQTSDASREFAEELLNTSGKCFFVLDESMIDAVTAVSGSGPAYVFHLIESLSAAAVTAGLPEDLAEALATQTILGAGALADAMPDNAGTLREQVTSPNGTTAAALSVLMKDDAMKELVTKAVIAARDRSVELGKG